MPDGQWISLTSEREGDVWRCRVDGRHGACVSTEDGFKANLWIVDLETGARRNLTGRREVAGNPDSLDGYFGPGWSPDEEWIAFGIDTWFDARGGATAKITRVRAHGPSKTLVTDSLWEASMSFYIPSKFQ